MLAFLVCHFPNTSCSPSKLTKIPKRLYSIHAYSYQWVHTKGWEKELTSTWRVLYLKLIFLKLVVFTNDCPKLIIRLINYCQLSCLITASWFLDLVNSFISFESSTLFLPPPTPISPILPPSPPPSTSNYNYYYYLTKTTTTIT